MPELKELFVLRLKNSDDAKAKRDIAREDFLQLDGVMSWRTYATTDAKRPQLFAEVFTYKDETSARAAMPQFAERPATRAFLGEVEEILVGGLFSEIS